MSFRQAGWDFFATGWIVDLFKHNGTVASFKEGLKMMVNTGTNWSAQVLKTHPRMPSGPLWYQHSWMLCTHHALTAWMWYLQTMCTAHAAEWHQVRVCQSVHKNIQFICLCAVGAHNGGNGHFIVQHLSSPLPHALQIRLFKLGLDLFPIASFHFLYQWCVYSKHRRWTYLPMVSGLGMSWWWSLGQCHPLASQ